MPSLFKQRHVARGHESQPPGSSASSVVSRKSRSSSKAAAATATRTTSLAREEARREFLRTTTKSTQDDIYTNPESLPSVEMAYNIFQRIYPKFSDTWAVDDLRDREYFHLEENQHVCMDYCGFGLFSYYQQVLDRATSSFSLAYISANLPTHALYGAPDEGTTEFYIRKRVMEYLNINDAEYSMVFTASRGSAFKLLAESYPFHLNPKLLTVYDFESEAVSWMAECAKQKGAKISSACFKWPSLRIGTSHLKKLLQEKKKRSGESAKGLFVFPVQSRMTGTKYSYQWMSQAQQNKWHVLLDASALGPKDMDSLGLSLFRPDFIVSSFYKVFGTDPTGFGCLFIKNTVIHSLHNSSRARSVGMVRIVSLGGFDEADIVRDSEDEDGEEEFPRGAVWGSDHGGGKVYPTSSFSGPYMKTGEPDFALEDGLRASSSYGGGWKPWRREAHGKSVPHNVDFSGQLTGSSAGAMDTVSEIDEGGPSEDEYEPPPISDSLLHSGEMRSGEIEEESPIRWSAEAQRLELPASLNGEDHDFDDQDDEIPVRVGDSHWRFGGRTAGEIEEDDDDNDEVDEDEDDDEPLEFQTLAGQGISPILEEEAEDLAELEDDDPSRVASGGLAASTSDFRPDEVDETADVGEGRMAATALSEIEEESDEEMRKTTMEDSSDEESAALEPERAGIFPVNEDAAVAGQLPGGDVHEEEAAGGPTHAGELDAKESPREAHHSPMQAGESHFAISDGELDGPAVGNGGESSYRERGSPGVPKEFHDRALEVSEPGIDACAASLDRRKAGEEEIGVEQLPKHSANESSDVQDGEEEQAKDLRSREGNGEFTKRDESAAGKGESPEVETQRVKASPQSLDRRSSFKRFTPKELSGFQELGVQGLVQRFQSLYSSTDRHSEPVSPASETRSPRLPHVAEEVEAADHGPGMAPRAASGGGTSLSAEDAAKGEEDSQSQHSVESVAALGGASHFGAGNSTASSEGSREDGAANDGLHESEMSSQRLSPNRTSCETAENGADEPKRGPDLQQHAAPFAEFRPEDVSESERRKVPEPEGASPLAEDGGPAASNTAGVSPREGVPASQAGKDSDEGSGEDPENASPQTGKDAVEGSGEDPGNASPREVVAASQEWGSDGESREAPGNAALLHPEMEDGGGGRPQECAIAGLAELASEGRKLTPLRMPGDGGVAMADQKDDYDASELEKSPARLSRTSSSYFSPTGSRDMDLPRTRSNSFDAYLNKDEESMWSGAEGGRAVGEFSTPPTSPRGAMMMMGERERRAGWDAESPARRNAVHSLQEASSLRTDESPGEENYITIMPRRSGKRGAGRFSAIDGKIHGAQEFSGQEESASSAAEETEASRYVDGERFQDGDLGAGHSWAEERYFMPSRDSPGGEFDDYPPSVSTPLHHLATGRHRRRESYDSGDFHDAQQNGRSDLRSNITLSRDVDFEDEELSGRPSDASDVLVSGRQSMTLSRDLALFDVQDSDDESIPSQYFSGSVQGSNASRYIGDDAPSAGYWEDDEYDTDDDFQDIPDVELWEGQREPLVSCKGLDFADSLGLTKLNYRLRYLINWLVNSLLKLRHPGPNQGTPLIRIYGPKVKYDRGASVAFNMFDWKGILIQPGLVQKLADRSNISLGVGKLCNIVDPDLLPDFLAERERILGLDTSEDGRNSFTLPGKSDPLRIPVVTAAMGFVTSFEDVYRLWSFLAKFLDADFVSKEVWKYHSLNQETIVM